MKRVMAWAVALLILLLCGCAFAEAEDTGHDVIFIVTRGPRMDRDDPEKTRFEWLAALAGQYAASDSRCVVVPCPYAEAQPEWQSLKNNTDVSKLKATLEQLDVVDYSDAPRVVSESLKAACALAAESNRPTTVILVHTGAIDVSDYDEETVAWLNSLGDELIILDTREAEDGDGNPIPVVSGLNEDADNEYILPNMDAAARTRLLSHGLSLYNDEITFTMAQGSGTFTLEADGAATLTLLLPESIDPQTLKLISPSGFCRTIQYDRLFKLNGCLCCRISLPLSKTAGQWTLTFDSADEGTAEVTALCSWTKLTGSAPETLECEFGSETALTLTLNELSGGEASAMQSWLSRNALAKAEIYALTDEGISAQPVETVLMTMGAEGWSGSKALDEGNYEVHYTLVNADGESFLSKEVVQTISVVNRAPGVSASTDAQKLVCNIPGQEEASLEWVFDDLFEDTPGDTLTYTYTLAVEAEGYDLSEVTDASGRLTGIRLAVKGSSVPDALTLTVTATDGKGATCTAALTAEPVDAMKLLGEITLNGRLSDTPKKYTAFAITARMDNVSDLLPDSLTEAIELQVSLGDNGWHAMTETDGEWRYDEKAPQTACDYDITLIARVPDETAEGGYIDVATTSLGTYHVTNSAPESTQADLTFDVDVEPFLQAHDFELTEAIAPETWFTDADGDEVTVTMTTEDGTLVREDAVIYIEKSEGGSEQILEGESEQILEGGDDVTLAVARGGNYRVTVSAQDTEGAVSIPVTIVIHAHSMTQKALILIAIGLAVLALIAVGLILFYRYMPGFTDGCEVRLTLHSRVLGDVDSKKIDISDPKKVKKWGVSLIRLYGEGGLPRVKALPAAVLKRVTIKPVRSNDVTVTASKLDADYGWNDKSSEKRWEIIKSDKSLLTIDVTIPPKEQKTDSTGKSARKKGK